MNTMLLEGAKFRLSSFHSPIFAEQTLLDSEPKKSLPFCPELLHGTHMTQVPTILSFRRVKSDRLRKVYPIPNRNLSCLPRGERKKLHSSGTEQSGKPRSYVGFPDLDYDECCREVFLLLLVGVWLGLGLLE